MAKYRDKNYVPGANMQQLLEKMLAMLPPVQQPSYRRIVTGDKAFKAAYIAADKTLPICAECGHNTTPLEANLDFGPQYWSRCCHAAIEQDSGAEP